jgi:hypothetical protein
MQRKTYAGIGRFVVCRNISECRVTSEMANDNVQICNDKYLFSCAGIER